MRSVYQASLNPRDVNQVITELLGKDQRIRELCVVKAGPFAWAALKDWGAIALIVALSEYIRHPAAYILACLLIAGRQHGFFALSHEAAHYRISGNKLWNDILGNSLFAYPVLFDTDGYRQNHLKHHGFLNSEQDPDWKRKIHLCQWQFPMPMSFVFKTLPKFVLWNGPKEWIMIMLQLARVLPLKDITKPESLRKVSVRALYYGALAVPLTYFSLWGTFLAYWVIPLVFFFPSIQRVRSVAEHFGLAREHDLNSTRNVMAPWYERILFGPHNINYHLDHHLIASVPFYNLPKLHEILLENDTYRRLGHENTSYILPSARSLSRDLFTQRGNRSEAKPADPEKLAA
jgi:fatty acid desaturase